MSIILWTNVWSRIPCMKCFVLGVDGRIAGSASAISTSLTLPLILTYMTLIRVLALDVLVFNDHMSRLILMNKAIEEDHWIVDTLTSECLRRSTSWLNLSIGSFRVEGASFGVRLVWDNGVELVFSAIQSRVMQWL
jgi:hypothetical protein